MVRIRQDPQPSLSPYGELPRIMPADHIAITLPDGSVHDHETGVTGYELASSISAGLARQALAVRVNGEVWDLTRPIDRDARIEILTWNDPDGQLTFRHSTAHLMAEALESLFSGVKFGIGPAIQEGFYYDIDTGDRKIGTDDLERIENRMRELAVRDVAYERQDISKGEAIQYFRDKGDEYKLELLEDLEDGTITFYRQGNFVDLCRGPHLPSTGRIKYIKLLQIAGAYWRGDERRPQLTRIYGVSFPKKSMLDEHLERLALAAQRDHRKLGKELALFTFDKQVGAGLPMWLPRGAVLRETLMDFLKKEQLARGYEPVVTPHIGRLELYKTSGHYPYYRESQFPPMLDEDDAEEGFLLKPMNCPHHIRIYANRLHSYRDLPVRYAEFGTVYRYEQSGELGGLTRVRGFTQDDAHIFCTDEQVKDEFKNVIDLTLTVLGALDFTDFKVQLSLHDPADHEKYQGDETRWEEAERAIREAVQETGLDAVEKVGEAAFYGPKLDFMVKDALGREWQLGTVQLDYNLPERFDLSYVGADDKRHRPAMIHRAPFGSLERFIGVLIEHCGGNFPLWLAPVQAMVIPISDHQHEYAEEVAAQLRERDIRVEVDHRNEKAGYKIRSAEMNKTPVMLITGAREQEKGTVSVRRHGRGEQDTVSVEDCVKRMINEIAEGKKR